MEHTFEFGPAINNDGDMVEGLATLKLTTIDDGGSETTDDIVLTIDEVVTFHRALDEFIFDLLLK